MKVKIATAHSENFKKDKGIAIEVNMQGGSPYFTYLWLNDCLYTLTTKGRTFTLRKLK